MSKTQEIVNNHLTPDTLAYLFEQFSKSYTTDPMFEFLLKNPQPSELLFLNEIVERILESDDSLSYRNVEKAVIDSPYFKRFLKLKCLI